eukprot:657442-Pleurochrysis_carterae.AAC.1
MMWTRRQENPHRKAAELDDCGAQGCELYRSGQGAGGRLRSTIRSLILSALEMSQPIRCQVLLPAAPNLLASAQSSIAMTQSLPAASRGSPAAS